MLNSGSALWELLIALAISALLLLSAFSFFPALSVHIISHYYTYRLEQGLTEGIQGLLKEGKRTGFIAGERPQIPSVNPCSRR